MFTAAPAATVIAAVSAIAAVGTLLAYLHFVRSGERDAARQEAIALAETRGQVIAELRARLDSLERRHRLASAASEKRIRELQSSRDRARAEAREQAYRAQRLYASALADLVEGLRSDLAEVPPDVAGALARIQELLADQRIGLG